MSTDPAGCCGRMQNAGRAMFQPLGAPLPLSNAWRVSGRVVPSPVAELDTRVGMRGRTAYQQRPSLARSSRVGVRLIYTHSSCRIAFIPFETSHRTAFTPSELRASSSCGCSQASLSNLDLSNLDGSRQNSYTCPLRAVQYCLHIPFNGLFGV